jgi:hypothetical protein
VDLGIPPIVARDQGIVSRLKGVSYLQIAGNRFARRLSGEVADGHHLIVQSVALSHEDLMFSYGYDSELTEEEHDLLDMWYDADISPPNFDYAGAGRSLKYARPPLAARHAWFDFFHPDYVYEEHFDRQGQPDSDYLRNRIARLTVDLKTGDAQIEK